MPTEQTPQIQTKPTSVVIKEQWEFFKKQSALTISTTPLPGLLSQLRSQIEHYKTIIMLIFAGIALLILISIGLNLGLSLAKNAKTPEITPPPLPSFTPTPSPNISSSFDQIYTDLNSFSSLLPDPAPPAVDPDITLQQTPR